MTTTKSNSKNLGTIHKPNVLLERFPYRYVTVGTIELNGKPDCRIQVYNTKTKRFKDMYLCDNEMQLMTAMEDKDYTLWLAGENCYRRSSSKQHYK